MCKLNGRKFKINCPKLYKKILELRCKFRYFYFMSYINKYYSIILSRPVMWHTKVIYFLSNVFPYIITHSTVYWWFKQSHRQNVQKVFRSDISFFGHSPVISIWNFSIFLTLENNVNLAIVENEIRQYLEKNNNL